MSATFEPHREPCETCEKETPHDVTIVMRTESQDPDSPGAKFSHEPYRVAECRVCGTESERRMNDA